MITKNKALASLLALVLIFNILAPINTSFASETNVITVAEAINNNTGGATVEGYIVGTRNVFKGPFTVATNIQIADSPDETDLSKTLPVQLPSGAVRTALNLVDNPQNLGKKVRLTGELAAYFAVPGLKYTSAYEFVDEEGTPVIPTTPTVSISEARDRMGETIITEGIVNIDNGLLQTNRLSVYIQDDQAGIQLFNYSDSGFPTIKAGDKVVVKGRVGSYNGVTQINVVELEVKESNQPVETKEVTIGDYSNEILAESYEGRLVTLEGYIYSIPDYNYGGANISLIDDNLNVVTIRAWESTGIDLSQLEENKWYQITAISSQYKNSYQILPRGMEDFVVSEVQKEKPFAKGKEIKATVERVVDGDTVRLVNPVMGAMNVRFLNIDTPETYHKPANELDENQLRLGLRSKEYLRSMLSDGAEVVLRLGDEPLDGYGRLLAEVINLEGVNTNLEMVATGNAVTYFIWPFGDEEVEIYSNALKGAREQQLGLWNPEDPLMELPFEFRARERGDELYRPVGDFTTKFYVAAADWKTIEPEYRVFFNSEEEAMTAGYRPQPTDALEITTLAKELVENLYSSEEIYKISTYHVLMNQINTIENHLAKIEEAKNAKAKEVHQINFERAIQKLSQDLEREFTGGNLSTKANMMMKKYIEFYGITIESTELENIA